MSNFTLTKTEAIQEKKRIEKMLKKCENKLKKLNKLEQLNNILYCINKKETPMPLNFNKITYKNHQREKSINYTKKLINKLKKRSQVKFENFFIKKEVEEEIEIPALEYF